MFKYIREQNSCLIGKQTCRKSNEVKDRNAGRIPVVN